jgi:hypothetical protein
LHRINRDDAGANIILDTVRQTLEKRSISHISETSKVDSWRLDPTVEELVRPVEIGNWALAAKFAVTVLEQTDDMGTNEIF